MVRNLFFVELLVDSLFFPFIANVLNENWRKIFIYESLKEVMSKKRHENCVKIKCSNKRRQKNLLRTVIIFFLILCRSILSAVII